MQLRSHLWRRPQQSGEGRAARVGRERTHPPRPQPHHVEGYRSDDMLEMRFRQPNIASPAHATAENALRVRALVPCSRRVEGMTSTQNAERIPPVRAKRHTGGMPPLTEWNGYPVRCLRFWWVR